MEVKTYLTNTAEVVLRHVYDDNQILLVPNTDMSRAILTLGRKPFEQKFRLLDKAQELFWRKEFMTENYICVLKYRVAMVEGRKECQFHQILPARLGFNSIDHLLKHYLITYHPTSRAVTNVKNRTMGDVRFKAIVLDDNAGFQVHSTVHAWTHHNHQVFNIAHLHLNDTSDEVPIDVQYLAQSQYSLKDIAFAKDLSGQPLRYKILVCDWKIRDILYNSGSTVEAVAFQEHPLLLSDYYA